jgi:hypothetical protein
LAVDIVNDFLLLRVLEMGGGRRNAFTGANRRRDGWD